jgi:hypothetical protein
MAIFGEAVVSDRIETGDYVFRSDQPYFEAVIT